MPAAAPLLPRPSTNLAVARGQRCCVSANRCQATSCCSLIIYRENLRGRRADFDGTPWPPSSPCFGKPNATPLRSISIRL